MGCCVRFETRKVVRLDSLTLTRCGLWGSSEKSWKCDNGGEFEKFVFILAKKYGIKIINVVQDIHKISQGLIPEARCCTPHSKVYLPSDDQ
jgi:hypothetical protein